MKEKICEFWNYCKHCAFEKLSEYETPCCDCLEQPVNEDSHKPVKFVAKKDGGKINGQRGKSKKSSRQ